MLSLATLEALAVSAFPTQCVSLSESVPISSILLLPPPPSQPAECCGCHFNSGWGQKTGIWAPGLENQEGRKEGGCHRNAWPDVEMLHRSSGRENKALFSRINARLTFQLILEMCEGCLWSHNAVWGRIKGVQCTLYSNSAWAKPSGFQLHEVWVTEWTN